MGLMIVWNKGTARLGALDRSLELFRVRQVKNRDRDGRPLRQAHDRKTWHFFPVGGVL